jgi:hypothetical protein
MPQQVPWLVTSANRESDNIREAARILDRLTSGGYFRHFQPKPTIASRLNLRIQLRNIPNKLIQPSLVALPGTRSNRRNTLGTDESSLIQPTIDFFHRDAGAGIPTLVLDLVAELAKFGCCQLGCGSHGRFLGVSIGIPYYCITILVPSTSKASDFR